MTDYVILEARIAEWAATHPDLIAGVVVGSRGRLDHPADQWSDLDLVFFCTATEIFIQDGSWLESFGRLWASWLDNTGSGYPEWFALYAGGLKLDIAFATIQPGDKTLAQMLASFAHQDVLERGVRTLFDKTHSTAQKRISPAAQPRQAYPFPSSEAFRARISQFWIIAAKTAKLIQRNDLWRAKQACDSELKACLLAMLEWHARATYGLEHDMWYDGRFLADWADPGALSELPATFAAYDQADLRRALLATIQLYHRLAGEMANHLGFDYPQPNDLQVADWITASLAG